MKMTATYDERLSLVSQGLPKHTTQPNTNYWKVFKDKAQIPNKD